MRRREERAGGKSAQAGRARRWEARGETSERNGEFDRKLWFLDSIGEVLEFIKGASKNVTERWVEVTQLRSPVHCRSLNTDDSSMEAFTYYVRSVLLISLLT